MSTQRTIKVVETKDTKITPFETDVRTWGEFIEKFGSNFDLKNLTATENINKTNLENLEAVLPEGDFRIFLRPKQGKIKSGGVDEAAVNASSYSELKNNFIMKDAELKTFLTNMEEGKNWTQLKTDQWKAGIIKYFKLKEEQTSETTTDVTEEATTEEISNEGNVANIVDSVVNAKEVVSVTGEMQHTSAVDQISNLLSLYIEEGELDVAGSHSDDVVDGIERLKDVLDTLESIKETSSSLVSTLTFNAPAVVEVSNFEEEEKKRISEKLEAEARKKKEDEEEAKRKEREEIEAEIAELNSGFLS